MRQRRIAWIALSCWIPRECRLMNASPCERKMSATSTVGRFIGPSACEEAVSLQDLGWRERRRDWSSIGDAAGTDADRSSLLQDRHGPEEPESFSSRFRAPEDELAAGASPPFPTYDALSRIVGIRAVFQHRVVGVAVGFLCGRVMPRAQI